MTTTKKILVFDMDGTITNLYGIPDWENKIHKEDVSLYNKALPLYDMSTLNRILKVLKKYNWHIVVTSWTAKNGSREYNKAVKQAKISWLNEYQFPYDELHIVKYGTTKANCTRKYNGFQILVDDNEKIRKGWKLGGTIDASKNIIEKLVELIEYERLASV